MKGFSGFIVSIGGICFILSLIGMVSLLHEWWVWTDESRIILWAFAISATLIFGALLGGTLND